MAAGSTSQQNFRKAIKAIKDSTLVGMAKVNNEYKDLDVSILKATNHVECLPKEKHVRTILGALSGSRPRADVAYCIHALTKRLVKTRTWVVALKTLIVIHRALREVDHSFCEELNYHNTTRGHLLNLLHFRDDSSPSAWDYSNWIRIYALYVEECLECFRILKYDFHRDYSRTKKFDTAALLEQLPAMQQLLFRLLACQPVGAAQYNFIIQYALSIVAAESVRLYVAITDGVLMLVDKFFEMQRRDAVRALEIYRKSGEQAQKLSEFFEICRSLDFGRRQKYVKIEKPPESFLTAMEEYVKDAPQTLMLPWRNDDGEATPKLTAVPVPDANLEDPDEANIEEKSEPSPDDSEENTQNDDKSKADAPPLIPDLLSWDDPIPEATELEENNSHPPTTTPGSELSSEPAGWELALVTTAEAASVAQNKGVLDRSTLDSLYDVALAQANTSGAYQLGNVSSNPFETDLSSHQAMVYDPSLVAPQPSFMQLAGVPQQQAALTQQQDQPMIGYDYMQIAGITKKQPASVEQLQQSSVGNNFMQMTEMPQPEVSTPTAGIPEATMQQPQPEVSTLTAGIPEASMQQPQPGVAMPQQQEPMTGQDPANPFGNPFMEQASLSAGQPQSHSSDFSLL